MSRVSVFCMSLFASLLITGCASKTTQPSQYSGFLADYSQLKPATSASGAPVLRWVAPGFKPESYSEVYVEKPVFYPAPKPNEQVSQATLGQISDYLQKAIERELSQRMRVVDTPTRDSLVLRTAITAVGSSAEGLQFYEVIPVALVLAAANTAAGTRDRDTNIYVEIEAVDARNNEPMVRVVRKGHGLQLENDSTQLTLKDIQPALDVWAKDARTFKP
ncbi:DUF3313 domain-containing protein [Pseudomonas sp. Gutcm_11s]|uniref:DUF3313 domain-containing protein n=1 Tax=Pseudomonas sp. Gutcm_11s TaxID=3026088 RepID=UPI00235F6606|nr:DUF3313 domain-containing protein [Pseudomonas sp. Gutcm_11s]MDD0844952.1 DUF3313 domain-containing protein [Pseudomonas sp. Gutcm_11s]